MDSSPKYLLLLTGIPASGKTSLADLISLKLRQLSLNAKILSSDSLQQFLVHEPKINLSDIHSFFKEQNWDSKLKDYRLNKQVFDEKTWNFSRKIVENFEILDMLFKSCSILIIEDELPLKSQRKPFKKYCSEKNILYLQIQVYASLQQALQNNFKRGKSNIKDAVSNQVILKSFQKYETSPDTMILTKQTIPEFLSQFEILSYFKSVKIQDNFTEYLAKKSTIHEHTENEMDENELRKLITKIIKDEQVSSEYFPVVLSAKQKALILTECKKQYIQQKRKTPFKQIITKLIQKKF